MNKIILLDSNSLINRAYYAVQYLSADGVPTNAVFGFLSMLARLIEEENPTHIGAAFDLRAPTFRHAMYDGYKAKRKPMPDDLAVQVPILKEILRASGIAVLEKEGYEADDILGTAAKRFSSPTIIVTGDRDSFQLIDDSTRVYYTRRGISDVSKYDLKKLKEDESFTPNQIIDFKAIAGDASDNIPGIKGIGEKTARKWLAAYTDLDNLYAHETEIVGAEGRKLAEGRQAAYLSRTLATIECNVPLDFTLSDIAFSYPLPDSALAVYQKYHLNNIIKRMRFGGAAAESIPAAPQVEEICIEIKDAAQLENAVNECAGKTVAAYFDKKGAFCFSADGVTEYKAQVTDNLFEGLTDAQVAKAVGSLLESSTEKVVFDIKRLRHTAAAQGVEINGGIFDQQLLAHLIKGGKNFTNIQETAADFGIEGESAATLYRLKSVTDKEAAKTSAKRLYEQLELPLSDVLYDMEKTGIKADMQVLSQLAADYRAELNTLTNDIYQLTGETFNINSPKQVAVILFEKLGLQKGKKTKTGLSSGIEVLNRIANEHPVVPKIIRYRQVAKLLSTYAEGLEKVIAADGRIHTEYKQTVTSTGRLSSVEPNLQNIPTRTADGREIRRAFVAGQGKTLVCADYSQIELRLLAHFSGDENLIAAYNESRDIHASTAAEIFGVPQSQVTAAMRRDAKAVNFGIIYGISDFGLATNLSISPRRAKAYIEKYFETYPKVREYMDKNVAFAKEHGYITTYLGRVRDIPEIKSPNYNVRSFGERAAMNMPLQGTAAEVIKLAMLKLYKNLKSTAAKMLLQVHDELIVECDAASGGEIAGIMQDTMEHAVEFKVPLTVNIKTGASWYEAD